jgi:hypothetical protein
MRKLFLQLLTCSVLIFTLTGCSDVSLDYSSSSYNSSTDSQFEDFDHTNNSENPYSKALAKFNEPNTPLVTKPENTRSKYNRVKDFGKSWYDADKNGCDTRNDILKRDIMNYAKETGVSDIKFMDKKHCKVESGTLSDVYSGNIIKFQYGKDTSNSIQIDHIVALKDAWMSGAQDWSENERLNYANDPFILISASGSENAKKGDGVKNHLWIPSSNPSYVCDYIAKRIEIKYLYKLWLLNDEELVSKQILTTCSKNY